MEGGSLRAEGGVVLRSVEVVVVTDDVGFRLSSYGDSVYTSVYVSVCLPDCVSGCLCSRELTCWYVTFCKWVRLFYTRHEGIVWEKDLTLKEGPKCTQMPFILTSAADPSTTFLSWSLFPLISSTSESSLFYLNGQEFVSLPL